MKSSSLGIISSCPIIPRQNDYEVVGATLQAEVTLIISKNKVAN